MGIMNIEVMENPIKLHNSTFLVRYSIFNKERSFLKSTVLPFRPTISIFQRWLGMKIVSRYRKRFVVITKHLVKPRKLFCAKWSCIVPKSMLNGVVDGKIIMLTAKNH